MDQQGVQIIGVKKQFGAQVALHGIDLHIRTGEFVSLLGPSGCGKTTLLRIISGFEEPTDGRVLIHGEDVTATPPHRRNTNIVFQRGALFPHMNVADNIGYSLKLQGLPKDEIKLRVDEMLTLVKLEGLAFRGPMELSGGQIQRVALARALASKPSVLLLDEPLSALDLKLRQHMQLELRAIQRQLGATFIYVTHDQTEALVMSDRIAVMNEGRIVQEGTPREIYKAPATVFASDFIGESNLFQGVVTQIAGESVHVDIGNGQTIIGKSSDVRPGNLVTLSVRPESVRVRLISQVDQNLSDSSDHFAGTVRDVIFLGSRTRFEILAQSGTTILADLSDEDSWEMVIGDTVQLSWNENSATVWQSNVEEK
jgi:ABC-type branched-subunit amino acid transport system ATPase component